MQDVALKKAKEELNLNFTINRKCVSLDKFILYDPEKFHTDRAVPYCLSLCRLRLYQVNVNFI